MLPEFYKIARLSNETKETLFEGVVALYNRIQKGYVSELQKLYQHGINHQLTEVDTSTLINFNQEFSSSNKAITWVIKGYLLKKDEADYFAELPGCIR